MVRISAGLTAALALLLSVSTASAQAPAATAARGVSLSELAGLDPVAVRGRLAAVPAAWPIQPAFQIATPQGALTFITVRDLMVDPALAEFLALARTQGDFGSPAPYLECREFLTRSGGAEASASTVVLMFREGRFEAAFEPVELPHPPMPNVSDSRAMNDYWRRPVTSPYLAHFGELPLEDGLGFLARWTKTALAPDDTLSAACAPPPPPPVLPPRAHHQLDASDMQGLALLPFAVTLPGKNRQRVAARREGAVVLASIRLGEPLGASPKAFAAGHPGVRAYPAKTGDYAVLSIDLGGYPGRNLSNFNDAALVGVRGGRVEWVVSPSGFGPNADLLCLDDRGVPNTPRPGCSGWGHFSP